jgi:hypothetical protein
MLEQIAQELNGAVNLTLRLYHEQGVSRKELSTAWEQFLAQFMAHLKSEGKAHWENLTGWINWTKLWR